MNLQYLQNSQIDLQKWDKCISKSVNGTIYGYSWFLNIVSEDWGALVDDKYETVMPVTIQKFLGLKILIQPLFAHNLGVFSVQVLDDRIVETFLRKISPHVWYIHLNLNKFNKLKSGFFKVWNDYVFELDLIPSYKKISAHYSNNLKYKIVKGTENKISVVQGMNASDLLKIYKENVPWYKKPFIKSKVRLLQMLISTSIKYRMGQVFGAYTRENNLCAAALFIWSHQKVFCLVFAANKIGEREFALEVLIDEFIKLHAEQNLTLRFEYLSRRKHAGLYSGFGAKRYEFRKIRRINFKLNTVTS